MLSCRINDWARAQLAVLPGTTHLTVVERADWLVPMISAFLDGPTSSDR